MDILLNKSHDLEFSGGDLSLTTNESQSLAQRLRVKLLTFRGEWFLDTNEGIPYFESIFGKNRAKQTIDVIFKRAILAEPEVISIVSFNSTINPNRIYELRFTVRSSNSEESIPVDLTI